LEKIAEREILLLENGVDYLRFSNKDLDIPNDLKNIPHPIIMYVGNLNRKVDLCLVDEISIIKPEWHWVLVGNIGSFDSDDLLVLDKLKNRVNVHFLGGKCFQELAAYELHADINVMIYKDDSAFWTEGIYPLKLNEYFAVGKPVISSYLPSLRKYDHLIQIVKGRDSWVNAIDAVLKGEYLNSLAKMQIVAKNNDWDIKVSQLDVWLRALFPGL
jgi:glycosyltransferase involved in cell wall biosynthesis